ncbi:hypothetical protein CWI39_3526p0010 [Hamiltosporidium magnivora]|uniref:Uncharacterized protein n=1 Tax=Hamiltosporidium magnivora TaxID=148818 RepID=A0A4Q9KPT2_9MICR|nr:hypothetical protein CWI39_3526p0010 [Hamiltosporidium magnivora]
MIGVLILPDNYLLIPVEAGVTQRKDHKQLRRKNKGVNIQGICLVYRRNISWNIREMQILPIMKLGKYQDSACLDGTFRKDLKFRTSGNSKKELVSMLGLGVGLKIHPIKSPCYETRKCKDTH